jgi:hypothetical protein
MDDPGQHEHDHSGRDPDEHQVRLLCRLLRKCTAHRRRRGHAAIGDQVGEGLVGTVADRSDDGDARVKDGLAKVPVVQGGNVGPVGGTPSGDDDDVDLRASVQGSEGQARLERHLGPGKQHVLADDPGLDPGIVQAAGHVAVGVTALTGDQANGLGQMGQGLGLARDRSGTRGAGRR